LRTTGEACRSRTGDSHGHLTSGDVEHLRRSIVVGKAEVTARHIQTLRNAHEHLVRHDTPSTQDL